MHDIKNSDNTPGVIECREGDILRPLELTEHWWRMEVVKTGEQGWIIPSSLSPYTSATPGAGAPLPAASSTVSPGSKQTSIFATDNAAPALPARGQALQRSGSRTQMMVSTLSGGDELFSLLQPFTYVDSEGRVSTPFGIDLSYKV